MSPKMRTIQGITVIDISLWRSWILKFHLLLNNVLINFPLQLDFCTLQELKLGGVGFSFSNQNLNTVKN